MHTGTVVRAFKPAASAWCAKKSDPSQEADCEHTVGFFQLSQHPTVQAGGPVAHDANGRVREDVVSRLRGDLPGKDVPRTVHANEGGGTSVRAIRAAWLQTRVSRYRRSRQGRNAWGSYPPPRHPCGTPLQYAIVTPFQDTGA